MEGRRSRLTLGVLGLGWVILLGVQSPEMVWAQGSSGGSIIHSYSKPIPLPDFSLEDLEGKKVQIRDFRGKVILLNFWATW